ncbi:signal recognition particle protein [Flavobacteriaceae bacterium]|jgi:signal recognition particle subunit SRP54|nr:signal recognition particle protein [Flavobacteriaceae bacterium]MDG1723722.1 signal recognition particle protein [Flavobacteriaceae bacterium]MDG2289742.1 signal recognition particle protein [Flavobacteriaceae bacterium]
MFEQFSKRLDAALKTLKGHGRITEINVAETMKEIRRALLDADVNFKIAKSFTQRVKDKAIGQKVLSDLHPGQLLIKIVQDELTDLLGGQKQDISVTGKPAVVLMSGLQGSGKTTCSAKLAKHLKEKQSKRVLLVACDIYRPAAIDQLKILGEQIEVAVFAAPENKNPVDIAKKALQHAKVNQYNVVIVDTAGRLAVDEELMQEIDNIHKAIKPTETLFVVDAMMGQDAVNTAKAFHDLLQFDGVVLTKMDGDTRGGAALSIKSVVDKPIKFIGTGEKLDALDVFHPNRMADRILGMGDVVSLVERAQEQVDEEEAKRIEKKIANNQFGYDDFLSQLKQVQRMGSMKDLVGMIPGASKALNGAEIDEDAFKGVEALIHSMTPKERQQPKLLNYSRKKRIAKGAGLQMDDINKLVKQFEQMSKMMKMMRGGKSSKLMQMFGK